MNSSKEDKLENENKPNFLFIKEVAKYFMDFLETDFHKRKNPKRSVQFRSANNFLIGININKYPSFNNIIWKAINNSFDKNIINTIKKGSYKTPIPTNLLDLIKLQSEKISSEQIKETVKLIADEIEQYATLYKKEYDKALNNSLESTVKILKTKIILPLVSNLEKPLENLNIGDENDVFLMEEELSSILSLLLENKISEILKLLLSNEKVNIIKNINEVFTLQDVKLNIYSFFENFEVGDLFSEIYEMERNRTILDKQEFYLYFCDITFNNTKYPIFYIPFSVGKHNNDLLIDFDSQVYVNKKAIEYITQEYNKENNSQGNLKTISERIIYLSQPQGSFKNIINEILGEIINFFGLDNSIDTNIPEQQISRSLMIRVSNTSYIALFDKSDEAVVNDYEEILKLITAEDSIIGNTFNTLIDDFIHKDPISFNTDIEDEWDTTETSDRLVFNSPIPLNSEQLQILSAIRKDDCKYIIVEGPPGTGKSHTITAIVFDAILKNKSVLVLSDKKEAIDVVEDKITETMNKVRIDRNFQNPILRLGKTGSTYSQILATSAVDNIKTHHRAIKKDYALIEENISKLSNTLKDDLKAEVLAYTEIDIKEIRELFDLESYYIKDGLPIDLDEVLDEKESISDLEEFRRIALSIKDKLVINKDLKGSGSKFFELLNFSIDNFSNISEFEKYLSFLELIHSCVIKIKDVYKNDLPILFKFIDFNDISLEKLKYFISEYQKEKNILFGYLLKREKINNLDKEFKKYFNTIQEFEPHKNIQQIKIITDIYEFANEIKNTLNLDKEYNISFDYLRFIHQSIIDDNVPNALTDLIHLNNDLKFLDINTIKYKKTIEILKLDLLSFKTLYSNELTKMSDSDFNKLIRLIILKQKIEKDFKNIPSFNYANQNKNIEELVTTQMTFLLDDRLINFYENNKATAKTLRDIIVKKQKFPKDEFLKLKEAFPCILAGIRDYAEYIPLEPNIFDLVIIDEASQVSIAQAFPALLRAKKVLILGDKKQFSNIKTAQARTDTNREYLNNLQDSFIKNISNESTKIVKLEKFNIKTSILEFFEFITNYNTQLSKHFRGYKELISYSNKNFYNNSLQVMKIRGKSIDNVIKFSFIKHDGKIELSQNTNTMEAEFIISELQKLIEENNKQTIGIITPHTNQQKLLVELINNIPERDRLYEELKLKIMTFDTCQGEERDIVFYSMVATEENDHLWGIFIKNLEDVNIEEDGKIKVQRLNVGFSRAKEMMHFVLSKPIESYNGSIGDALKHYSNILNESKKEHDSSETDQKSKMEPEVLNWFYQTDFWITNKNNIELTPQFELGKYLKQLDKKYNHAKYKVDFLLVYKNTENKEYKIIIEYDGFREHFKDAEEINEFNYQNYFSESDVYRQKILEGYGYKFLRINKFNSGKNPVLTLNDRLYSLIKNGFEKNNVMNHIHETIEGLQNGDMKECPKCKEIRDNEDFRDTSLISGFGRFCKHCKEDTAKNKEALRNNTPQILSDKICPKCGSKMILRRGKYGQFYGCSRFPYCRGVKQN